MTGEARFNGAVNSYIEAAHQLALERGSVQCEPVHLLVVMLEDERVVGRVLRRHGVDVGLVQRRVREQLPAARGYFGDARGRNVNDGVLRVSPAFKAVLDGARELAQQAGARVVDEVALLQSFAGSEDEGVRRLVSTAGLPDLGGDLHAGAGGFDNPALFQMLNRYGRVLTAEAASGLLDPVIGRDHELQRVAHILGRRRKNNPVLIGEPGVGKTALVEGLAQAIVKGEVPSAIAGKHVFSLDVGSLVAGTKYRGEFEERVQLLLDGIASAKGSIILFIDELHTIARAGGAEGAIDAASFFKPMLARGELHAIGATTDAEYREHIARDGALERRFQPVYVAEPSEAQALEMLRGLRSTYEEHHGVRISDSALEEAVRISVSALAGRRLPDKAIDLVDEAASQKRALLDQAEPDGAGGASPGTTADRRGTVDPEDVRRVFDDWVSGAPRERLISRFRRRPAAWRARLRSRSDAR
jgi:ATP-dependent Clp protease ATP-binding subunit ClpB